VDLGIVIFFVIVILDMHIYPITDPQIIQNLIMENNQLKEKLKYLEDKIKQLISEKIEEKKNNK
jgi:hypothetical protein